MKNQKEITCVIIGLLPILVAIVMSILEPYSLNGYYANEKILTIPAVFNYAVTTKFVSNQMS